jgi:hypothetical protein
MTNITIFKNNTVATSGSRESALGQTLSSGGGTYRRIQTNTNGTFKRLVNGEQIGNAVRGELDVVIVGALPKVSRVFYAGKYDPNAEAKAPDCWSNLGDVPDPKAPTPQASSCAECPQNIKGSGTNGGRACRYQRRLAVLLAGDDSGDIYQMNIPSKSLFGKGVGNVHPFESYVKFLLANREGPDTVVTNVSYDLNAESMELRFTPLRNLDDDEYALVQTSQLQPEVTNYTKITMYESSQKPAAEPKPKPKIQFSDEPDEDNEEPVKRTRAPIKERPVTGTLAEKVTDLWGED